MGATDPTYPLYPIASIIATGLLLLVLLTSFIRQNWNLGVTFLCFWLLLENLTAAVNAIIWSDNADIKHYIYCDIVSHLQILTYIVKPMSTLIITRRLYLIASLFVPLLIAGPICKPFHHSVSGCCALTLIQDYVHQGTRFEVERIFGCTNSAQASILELLTMDLWTVIPPLVSVLFFYPKVIRIFYQQSRDVRGFLGSNASVSRTNYLRIIILASIDLLLTLPFGIVSITLEFNSLRVQEGFVPFYLGWTSVHSHWKPLSTPYTRLADLGTAYLAQIYFTQWTAPVLAFVIFGLFGLTSEARASYWHIIYTVGGWFGWKPVPRSEKEKEQASLGEIEFGARQLEDVSPGDVEMGSGCVLASLLSSIC
ncbi:hypothetical protein PENSPDRAFT_582281 [Peniophora sp. CONT]|nr:hypothetical protein PENSPDRAFT_582281 [Peniophora sp. CONT]